MQRCSGVGAEPLLRVLAGEFDAKAPSSNRQLPRLCAVSIPWYDVTHAVVSKSHHSISLLTVHSRLPSSTLPLH